VKKERIVQDCMNNSSLSMARKGKNKRNMRLRPLKRGATGKSEAAKSLRGGNSKYMTTLSDTNG